MRDKILNLNLDNDPLFDEIKYFITSKNNNIIDYKFGSKVLGILNII